MGFSPRMGRNSGGYKGQPKRRRLRYERRVTLYALLIALPGMLVSGVLLWLQPWTLESKLAVFAAAWLVWWLFVMALREQTTRPLQTLANVIAALHEEDYSFRARGATMNDAMGELSLEVNALADELANQRIGSIEATNLLRRVVEEVEVPLFTFDPDHVLRLINPAGERLLQQSSLRLIGSTAKELGLESCLTAEDETLLPYNLNTPNARWLVRRSSFRQKGIPHTLVVLSDVSRALREEERKAWQRLIRVLGHELNNSLASIKSIAGSLSGRVSDSALHPEERLDFQRGLEIIETRAASLNRFLQAYRQLAQIPPPNLRKVALDPIVKRVVALETRMLVHIASSPAVELSIDPDQFEQMLINLIRNAVEAALEQAVLSEVHGSATKSSGPAVSIGWDFSENEMTLKIEDNGPGLLNPGNVFVPFYTTKPSGSGIGLVLARQIVEAHGGTLELLNRTDSRGCIARVSLPSLQS